MAAKAKAEGNGKPVDEYQQELDAIDLDNLGEIEIDLKQVPFSVSKGGKKTDYVLREMGGILRDRWLDELFSNHMQRIGETDKFETVKHEGLETILLVRSVFTPNGQPLKPEEFDEWPPRARRKVYLAARKISHLDKKSPEEARKNS